MNLDFKKIVALIFIAGVAYAWYTGMLDEFTQGLGNVLGGTAKHHPEP